MKGTWRRERSRARRGRGAEAAATSATAAAVVCKGLWFMVESEGKGQFHTLPPPRLSGDASRVFRV